MMAVVPVSAPEARTARYHAITQPDLGRRCALVNMNVERLAIPTGGGLRWWRDGDSAVLVEGVRGHTKMLRPRL